jgi:hypothetical protein
LYEEGRARRLEIQTGLSDGKWIEVTNYQPAAAAGGADPWVAIDGKEQVILGDLSLLIDGGAVQVAPAGGEANIVSATTDHRPAKPAPGAPATLPR